MKALRIILAAAAVMSALTLVSCADESDDPGDSLTDTTDTEETSAPDPTETEPDTTETEPIETEPAPEPVTISGVTYELRDGGYVVTGVTSPDASRAVLVDKIEETPVIGIADGAFDSVADPLNFRIFGYEDTFAREYAVENGHIFIEYYNGKLPDHYYPEGVKLYDWVEKEPSDIALAIDDNAEIDKLVSDYLNGKDVYDEILERVLYRMICNDLFHRWFDSDWAYYSTEGWWYSVGDYDRYVVYLPPEEGTDWMREFEMGRFGQIESYSELTKNVALLSQNNFWLGEILNVEDHIFMPYVGSGSPSTSDESCSITITEDSITLSAEYSVWDEVEKSSIQFRRTDDGWYFFECEDDTIFNASYELYKLYYGEIRNKYNNNN